MKSKTVLFIDALFSTLGKLVVRAVVLTVILAIVVKGVGVYEG